MRSLTSLVSAPLRGTAYCAQNLNACQSAAVALGSYLATHKGEVLTSLASGAANAVIQIPLEIACGQYGAAAGHALVSFTLLGAGGLAAKSAAAGADGAAVLDQGTLDATTGGSGFVDFAHGTSLESAQSIAAKGLSEVAARGMSRGGLYAQPGSFFTFNATEGGQEAVQIAYEMGLRHAEQPVVLMGRVPPTVYRSLVDAGHVYSGSIPGSPLPETVFSPAAFPTLNGSIAWQILDPFGRL